MIVATTYFNHPDIRGVVEFEERGTKVVIKGNLRSAKYKTVHMVYTFMKLGTLPKGVWEPVDTSIHMVRNTVDQSPRRDM